MARTKQTARQSQQGKPVANFPKRKKVILQYSSDEGGDQQVPGVDFRQPNRVTKKITLTLPTKPTHVTLTDSFHQFFIRHGMNRALQKALQPPRLGQSMTCKAFQTNYTAKIWDQKFPHQDCIWTRVTRRRKV